MAHVPEVTGEAGDDGTKHDIPRELLGAGTLADQLSRARNPMDKAGNRNYPGHGPSTPKG